MKRLEIEVTPGEYAVAKLGPDAPVPAGLLAAGAAEFVSVTRTPAELSVTCRAGKVPAGAEVEAGLRLLTVCGPLAFTLTGVIAALANELAAAGIALFTVSTFDTDHVLVKEADLARAVETLRAAGHEVGVAA
ncbi:MAG TPA: ACT domain-containing protein [Amycolatopsis sp.]|uniref:ACT domain-containing protein n=1 Tax=Amycolatopsis sp. TaxID=37632 RepID=UPI002B484C27|nr:ACT domain-containing protein [Amycolatopsis sp.]HKS49309.1 ACT domain-containing protein [Amycolatopsis sp.]